jgi:hypothetical protein
VEPDVLLARQVLVDARVLEDDPMFRRTSVASRSRSWPAMVTVPLVLASVVVRMLMVVVLPAPFGPRKANNSPGATSKLMSSTAGVVAFL